MEHPVLLMVKTRTNQTRYWISLPVVCAFPCQGILGGLQVFSAQGKAGFPMKPLQFLLSSIKKHRTVTVIKNVLIWHFLCVVQGTGITKVNTRRMGIEGSLRLSLCLVCARYGEAIENRRFLLDRSLWNTLAWWNTANLGLGEVGFLLRLECIKYALLSRFRILSKLAWE